MRLYIGVLQGQVFTWMWPYVRVSIHVNKDDMTWQCIVQWGVEKHMQNCEHDLAVRWRLLGLLYWIFDAANFCWVLYWIFDALVSITRQVSILIPIPYSFLLQHRKKKRQKSFFISIMGKDKKKINK